jgi:hypothetical protein
VTKIKQGFALIVILGVALAAWTLFQPPAKTTTKQQAETYRIKVYWRALHYVLQIDQYVSNKKLPETKLDATGEYGTQTTATGVWHQDVLYVRGTGGIVVDVHISSGNPETTVAACEIWKLSNGRESVLLEGPESGDRKTEAYCQWDRK